MDWAISLRRNQKRKWPMRLLWEKEGRRNESDGEAELSLHRQDPSIGSVPSSQSERRETLLDTSLFSRFTRMSWVFKSKNQMHGCQGEWLSLLTVALHHDSGDGDQQRWEDRKSQRQRLENLLRDLFSLVVVSISWRPSATSMTSETVYTHAVIKQEHLAADWWVRVTALWVQASGKCVQRSNSVHLSRLWRISASFWNLDDWKANQSIFIHQSFIVI